MTKLDFAATVRRRLVESRQSKHRAALESGLPQDAIRSVLKGHSPRLDRVEEICEALGLELYIGPPGRGAEPENHDGVDRPAAPRPLTSFSTSVELPVRRWARCSPEGYLTPEPVTGSDWAPSPVDLVDPQAFYAREPLVSMVPAGIDTGNYCLVSRCAAFEPGQRVWLRNRAGHETIKWLIELTATTYELRAWRPPDSTTEPPQMLADRWLLEGVVDRGVILAVYRTKPSVKKTAYRAADWRPDRVTARWQSELQDARLVDNAPSGEKPNEELLAEIREGVDELESSTATIKAQMASLNRQVSSVLEQLRIALPERSDGRRVGNGSREEE